MNCLKITGQYFVGAFVQSNVEISYNWVDCEIGGFGQGRAGCQTWKLNP